MVRPWLSEADGAHSVVADHAVAYHHLSSVRVLRDADLARAELNVFMPRWLESWMYPINKTDLDVLRFIHFLARLRLSGVSCQGFRPARQTSWQRPVILCGQHSLEIFCLGVFLAFAGHSILAEFSGGAWTHFLISVPGIVIMSAAAWLFSW